MDIKELSTKAKITWCPGCFNNAILLAFKKALVELNLKKEQVAIVTGIGCHAKIYDYINVNAFYSIHGRTLPTATGIKIVNRNLKVIAFAGDGDQYNEGIAHLIHAAKRNSDVKLFVHDNGVFALTTGQFTATTKEGKVTPTSLKGNIEEPLNPLAVALASNASFVARAFAGDVEKTKEIMKEAIMHKGFAIVDILQPCLIFNNFYEEVNKRKVYLEKPLKSKEEAYKKIVDEEKIYLGIFYKEERETFEEKINLDFNPFEKKKLSASNFL